MLGNDVRETADHLRAEVDPDNSTPLADDGRSREQAGTSSAGDVENFMALGHTSRADEALTEVRE